MTDFVTRQMGRVLKFTLSRLPIEKKLSVLYHLAPQCGVTGFGVTGEYGEIFSASTDTEVLRDYALTKTWAKRTNDILLSFFQDEGGSYIDIGANIGMTTIPVAQNERVSCLAIEPEPVNFKHLSANVAMHCPHGNVELRRLAIYTQSQAIQMEIATENLGDHRLQTRPDVVPGNGSKRPTITVDAAPLDSIAGNRRGRLAVKIDTQGAEPFVIASGRETLSRANLIIIEFAPYLMARLGSHHGEIIAFLRQQFETLRIAMNESDPISAPLPTQDVCNQLESLAVQHSENHQFYLDIIATR
jgi:FkbM family methyltransferase